MNKPIQSPRGSGRTVAAGKAGMTLVEMSVSMLILGMVAAGILYGALTGMRLNYAAAQKATAFNRCMDLYEQMRATDFAQIVPTNFPAENLRLTHLGGLNRVPVMCTRTCRIVDQTDPDRKEVQITVSWTYRGHPLSQQLSGMIYRKL